MAANYTLLHKGSKTLGANLCVVTVSQETSDSGGTFVHCHTTELLRRKEHVFSFPAPVSFGALPLWQRAELAAELASTLSLTGDDSVSAGFAVELPVELRAKSNAEVERAHDDEQAPVPSREVVVKKSGALFPRLRLHRSSTRILPVTRTSTRLSGGLEGLDDATLRRSRLSGTRLGHPHSPKRLRHLLLAAYHLEVIARTIRCIGADATERTGPGRYTVVLDKIPVDDEAISWSWRSGFITSSFMTPR